MKTSIIAKLVATTVCGALVATPVLAEKANRLQSITGMDAWGAERALKDRGFKHISSHKNSRGYTYSYWWDDADDNCVRAEVYNDTVETLMDATDKDCNHSGGSTGAAVGAVAGLAIPGALLASKSHHREGKDYNEEQTGAFDRGYKDGLHNAAYHNYDRSDAYSHGYEKGVDERQANLSHHHNRGGYYQTVRYNDLQGARAAGATEELGRRGFRQVDNFTSGNTRYGIYSRRESNQCLQVTFADGRIYDIRDIGQHPRC